MLMRPLFAAANVAALSAGGAPAYDADATAYFAYAGALGDARKLLISDLVAGIKSDLSLTNLSDKFDGFWLLANETSTAALKNIAKNDHHCTVVNAPTFTADQGYAGNGTTSYVRTDYFPDTDKAALSVNSQAFGVYVRSSRTTGPMCNIGAGDGTGAHHEFTIHACYDGTTYMNIAGTFFQAEAATINAQGLRIGSRTGASLEFSMKNGSVTANPNSAAVGICPDELFIGARNINGSGTTDRYCTDQHAFAFVGGALSSTQAANVTTRVETYLDAISAGIIP